MWPNSIFRNGKAWCQVVCSTAKRTRLASSSKVRLRTLRVLEEELRQKGNGSYLNML